MKRFSLLAIAALFGIWNCFAIETIVDGIKYSLNTENKTAEVIQNSYSYSGNIVIPASIEYEGERFNVTSIGKLAFQYCDGITSVTISEGVVSIGTRAFESCENMYRINIPNSVNSIGEKAFRDCRGLKSITIPSSVSIIRTETFCDCWELNSVTIPNGVTNIENNAFYRCQSLTSVVLPSTLTRIGDAAFYECTKLATISMPDEITYIGVQAFGYCSALSSVTIPKSLSFITERTFEGCKGLTSVTIPDGITNIKEYAFHRCYELRSVTIPSSVTNIGEAAFSVCYKLADIYCYMESVPKTSALTFYLTDIEASSLHVPASAIEAYKASEPWSKFGKIEAIQPYHPFVEAGKLWRVHGFNMGSSHTVTDYYFSNEDEAETIDGHTYLKMYAKTGEETTLVGLFREENQRVYLYKKDAGREFLTYDFSLEEGDRFSPEYGDYSLCEVKEVSYKDVNGERLKVITFEANDRQIDADVRTEVEWIEGIGYTSRPLAGLFSKNMDPAWYYYTAYVLYDTTHDPYNYYLPFSFHLPYDGWWGQQLLQIKTEYERNFKLDCEFLPDPENDCYKLHVYGYKMLDVSPNKYVYCIRESDNKLRIQFEELDPVTNYTTPLRIDLYFPFFSPGQYTYVDELGEHPVPIREALVDNYRPFVEDGKVWKVGLLGDAPGWFDKAGRLDFYYFDGDTIIDGRDCKKMMRKTQYSHEDRTATYVGALYEENRCVYCALPNRTDFVLLYDFVATPGTELTYYSTDANEITKGFIKERSRTENEKYHGVTTIVFPSIRNIYVDYDTINLIWREGVGYNGFNNGHNFDLVGGFTALMSCTIGDEVLYFDPEIIDCVTPEDSEVKKNTIDFTHTVKTRPKAPRRGAVNETGGDEPLTGEYSLKELFVNFKPLAGPYVITICDDSGTEVYRKEVQTSNVIGLNTDISGYEKGEYTITVENDEEAYTAKLSIDEETAIQPLPLTPSPVSEGEAGAMYDLSGRKLNTPSPEEGRSGLSRTLPKGIYIRDGRKVVVR